MDIIWIGVLVVPVLWAIFSFRSKRKAREAFDALDLAGPWFKEQGFLDHTIRFSKYEGSPAVKHPDAALIVGMGETEVGRRLGFAVEISTQGDVLKAVVLEPSLASHHRSAYMGSVQSGESIIDLLEEKSIQADQSATMSSDESSRYSEVLGRIELSGMIASTLDHIFCEMDLEAILSGYIIVRRTSVGWSKIPEKESPDVLGNCSLGQLESTEILRMMATSGMSDMPEMNMIVDQMVLEIVRNLEDNSPAFRSLQ